MDAEKKPSPEQGGLAAVSHRLGQVLKESCGLVEAERFYQVFFPHMEALEQTLGLLSESGMEFTCALMKIDEFPAIMIRHEGEGAKELLDLVHRQGVPRRQLVPGNSALDIRTFLRENVEAQQNREFFRHHRN